MRIVLIYVLLLCCTALLAAFQAGAQDYKKPDAADHADTISLQKSDTATLINPFPQVDSAAIREQLGSGIQSLMRIQEENRRKQKQGALLRIGFGLAMLAVLVIGLLRKRKR
jgi:hypothetical protein